jgi:bifunctional DNA-binding transcriptional regulator/antitoxin component of YhaV-PrlF toxin-antitoxin module
MTAILKVESDRKVTIPNRLWAELGLVDGGFLEARAHRGSIVLTPKPAEAAVRNQYAPAQRRYIDRRLDKAEREYRRGRFCGPFDTAEEAIAGMKSQVKKIQADKRRRAKRSR